MTQFLPDNYEVPNSAGNYMKLISGENRFRILDSPIIGNEYWNHQKKPVRVRIGDKINMTDIREDDNGELTLVKHFWAMPVWSYTDKKVMILELTQKTLLKAIKELSKDEDWGNPRNYDLVITKEGEKMNTEYNVKPKPAKELDPEIKKAWQEVIKKGFDLNELYNSGDPFAPTVNSDISSNEQVQIYRKSIEE